MPQDKAKKAAVDVHIKKLSAPAKARMIALRRLIKKAAPGAEESISYAMPAFKRDGGVVWYAAFKNHSSLFAPTVKHKFKRELRAYSGTKAAIHFPYDKPIPAGLITKIVKAAMKTKMYRR